MLALRSGFVSSLMLLVVVIGCGSSDSGGSGTPGSMGGTSGSTGTGGLGVVGGSGGVIVGSTGGASPNGGTGNVGTGGVQPASGGSPGTGGTIGSTGGTSPGTGGTSGGTGGQTGGTGGAVGTGGTMSAGGADGGSDIGGADGGTECVNAPDCPGTDTSCSVRTCASGTCGVRFATSGTSCTVGGGTVCNGNGTCVQCVTGGDCPGTDTDCHVRACTSGTCGLANTSAGTVTTSQTAGDCIRNECDGNGNARAVADDTDVPVGGQCCGNKVACTSPTRYCSGGACTSTPPSCQGLASNCGLSGNESCCTSPLVTGGTFYRSYDGVGYTDQGYPATVSDFRLDKFEVTVGQFRKFKAAWDGGWRPAAGAGKHTHLNGGSGLANSGTTSYEPGWDTAWSSNVALTDTNLSCNATYQNWTSSAGANENRPMNCATFYAQYAFCIWDGGFLPSEAEWNYAAAGGNEQRVYPWSSPATSTTIDCTYANYYGAPGPTSCSGTYTNNVGSESPKGNGKYGQADLAGNIWEWNLDWYVSPYVVTCNNCSYLPASSTYRMIRGGTFFYGAPTLLVSYRNDSAPSDRSYGVGARCARSP